MLSGLLVLAVACERPRVIKPEDINRGERYFPMAIGNQWLYEVEEIQWAVFESDTCYWEYEWAVTDTFRKVDGQLQYVIEERRRKRGAASFSDTVKSIGVEINNNEILWTAGNVLGRYAVFPVEPEQVWDYYTYSGETEPNTEIPIRQENEYREIDLPLALGDTTFPETIQIHRQEESSSISEIEEYDYFAAGLGRVYGLDKELNFVLDTVTQNWRLIEGHEITYQLKEYTIK